MEHVHNHSGDHGGSIYHHGGSLRGHSLPGSFFVLFGIFHICCILKRFYRSHYRSDPRKRYKNIISFSCPCLTSLPLEAILKLTATFAIMAEFIRGYEYHSIAPTALQHSTMYFFFVLTGIVDILVFYKIKLPTDTNYAFMILALVMQAFVTAHHSHSNSALAHQVHGFLLYPIIGALLCTVAEMRYRYHVMPAVGRAFFLLVQGTWLFQIGFILFPPMGMGKWDEHNHDHSMFVTVIHSAHYAVWAIVILAMATIISVQEKKAVQNAEDMKMDEESNRTLLYERLYSPNLGAKNFEEI